MKVTIPTAVTLFRIGLMLALLVSFSLIGAAAYTHRTQLGHVTLATETLAEVPDVSSRLSADEIADLLDPTQYTGLCSLFAERAAPKARKVSDSLG